MTWEWRFPADKVHSGGQPALKDLAGEVVEAAWAVSRIERPSMVDQRAAKDAAVELMDVVHVAETELRRIEREYGVDMDAAYCATVAKNESRGYYG